MSFTDVSRNFACGMGRLIGGSFSALGSLRKALGKSIGKLRPRSSREKIRSVVIDELTRLAVGDAELAGAKLEERLQVMAETILALQKRINELSVRGPVSETDMWEAMSSLKAAESLTDDERAILVTVFRQNIAIQKPDLIDTAVVQNSLKG